MSRSHWFEGPGFHSDSLERIHLLNLGEMGHIQDELGRNIEDRLDELAEMHPVPTLTSEQRLHLAMSTDWQTTWQRKPLHDDPYDGGEVEPMPAPYDFEFGKVIRFVTAGTCIVLHPRPFAFLRRAKMSQFFRQLREDVDQRRWHQIKISRRKETGSVINRFLEVTLPLPCNHAWPHWASGIRAYLFGDIVDTRWWAIYRHHQARASRAPRDRRITKS